MMGIRFFSRRLYIARQSHFVEHKEVARKIILARLQHWAPRCGVNYKRVAIRNQRRRWGSCSSLGNLNFNYKLAFLPSELCDYVVVHELCHLKEMNHGPNFWGEVEKVLPEYRLLETELKRIEKSRDAYLKNAHPHSAVSVYYETLAIASVS